MTTDDLYDAFRSDVVDTAKPYLWSDDEVFRYMADTHRMFIRLTGGIADVSSDATSVDLTAGEAFSDLHPSILRIMSARRASDNSPLQVINQTDLPTLTESDYGRQRELFMDDTQGPVRYMLIGQERDKCRWVQIPVEADTVYLSIYRLPLDIADGPGKEISEVAEEHHIHLLDWMKRMAYRKQDAETFDKGKSEQFGSDFFNYCQQVKAEWGRYKHKTRIVAYGGL